MKNYGAYGKARKFNGKRFAFRGIFYSKTPAQQMADSYRKQGHLVRVVHSKDGGINLYNVYVR
jgi:hypothetical protein